MIIYIKKLINDRKIRWTNHVIVRIFQRNITRENIIGALLNGEVIEEYEDNKEWESDFKTRKESTP